MNFDSDSQTWAQLRYTTAREEGRRWASLSSHVLPERDTLYVDQSACGQAVREGVDADLWYGEDLQQAELGRDYDGGRSRRIKLAKGICAQCPVRQQCLKDALDRDDQWGIWGGLTVYERKRLTTQQAA